MSISYYHLKCGLIKNVNPALSKFNIYFRISDVVLRWWCEMINQKSNKYLRIGENNNNYR